MQGGPCTPIVIGTSMVCVVPNFTSTVSGLKNISYTITVGLVPGPDLTNMDLTLDMKPNPLFSEDGSAITENEMSGLLLITVSPQWTKFLSAMFCVVPTCLPYLSVDWA